jgi:hypothetical protein
MALRDVADASVAAFWCSIENPKCTADRLLQTEEQAKQCCLARAVGTNDGHKLATLEAKVRVSPNNLIGIACYNFFACDDLSFD